MKLHRKFEINSPNHNAKKNGWKTKEAILSDKPREKLYPPPVSPVGGLINDYIIFFLAINMRDIVGHFCKTQPKLVLFFYILIFIQAHGVKGINNAVFSLSNYNCFSCVALVRA